MISRIRRRAAVVLMVLGLALGIPLGVVASHQFADVPDSNIFHDDIDALVNNGITFGCGGGNFCPSNFVTREQMAAFMNRLGSLDGTTAPSVNADMVDGVDAGNLLPGGTLPAGATIRGSYGVDFAATGAGDRGLETFQFGYTLASAPTEHFIPAGGIAPAECPGSGSLPEAAPGHLCVYESLTLNVGFACVVETGPTYLCDNSDPFGAGVFVTAAGAGTARSTGSWAVTSAGGVATVDAAPPSETCAEAPQC